MPGWTGRRRQGGDLRIWIPCLLGTLIFGGVLAADEQAIAPQSILAPHVMRSGQLDEAFPSTNGDSKTGHAEPAPAEKLPRLHLAAAGIDKRVQVVKKASSARSVRKAAAEALPFARMSDEHRARVTQIVNGTGVFRELPTLRFEADPRVYRFFMDHPEVAVGIWRVMQISDFQMRQTAHNAYETDDGQGTSGVIDVAYRAENEIVVLCDGVYKSPLLPRGIKANGVMHLHVGFERGTDGKTYVTHNAKLFVAFPSQTVETAAKIMSPVSYSIIDQNFREVSLFLHMMSLAMQRQPGWVENVTNRLDAVTAARKTQLMEVTVQVYADANPRYAREARPAASEQGRDSTTRPTRTASGEDQESLGSNDRDIAIPH